LVASARVAHTAHRAAEYGISLPGPVEIDFKRVMLRMDEVVRRSNQGLGKWLERMENVDVLEGHARFEGPYTVRVGDEILEGKRIYINVGTRPSVPAFPGIDDVRVLTNEDMLTLDHVPQHLVVVGGSYVGLEFGQIFRRFGSEVTIVERLPHLLSREDEDVSTAVREIFENEGVRVRTGAECIAMSEDPRGVKVILDCDDDPREVTGTHLLLAVGRVPNTDDLGLGRAGIDMDDRGYIVVDDLLQTNVADVFALGDVNGRGAFTHTAFNDHEIVADNLLKGGSRRVSDRISAYALFIDPPLGRVGMTEAQVRQSGRPALVGRRPMSKVSRAVEKGETSGFMKILVDADSHQILGASILGVGGDEVVHSILNLMYAKAPYKVMQHAVQIHPTVTELIPTMLGDLKPLGEPASS
jgi:pyruvate/2-oxoglutarate dehydrogenase complex dihydrolipoamide dehydrogenase (E3) component